MIAVVPLKAAVGWVMVEFAEAVQFFESVIITEYVPAAKPLAVAEV